ncbi:Golgi phosphoprotein 3 (GPP34) [Streptomyces sp. TLI_053]|uniref:GOLPH3/VPS74 family protein n=1 Tax=Streptomyces sp. TLI_053 TaxID=1855352 RepID=UPI00087CA62B|nr:GPP34 family phosphoprotein [Streptomyces sp. TLI_053]SDT76075.1 Golgi phosphoprotein 3 (GPP34) [Streptomyces sp. TLI_053]
MTPLGPPDPPAASGRRPLVLAEELVLLCTDPDSGTLRVSRAGFQRAVAAAVLAELLLTGGLAVDDRRITAFRPVGAGDEVTAGVLARLERTGKGRRPGLDRAIRQVPRVPAVQSFRERLVASGHLTLEHRRILLLLPYRAWPPVRPTVGAEIAERITAALRAPSGPGAGSPGTVRDQYLAGLLWAAQLDRRLFPGREHSELRKSFRTVAREQPIAQALRRVVGSDNAGGG